MAAEEGLIDGEDNEDEEISEREEISAAQPPSNTIPIPDKDQQKWVGWRVQSVEERRGWCKLCEMQIVQQ